MCWRQVSKLQKTVLIVLFYFTIYVLVSYSISPETNFAFVSDNLRVGDKYALIYLVAPPRAPVFFDSEGADVFRARRCGQCFITNNPGFLPMSEFDAILIVGDRTVVLETAAMNPGKRFLLITSRMCVRNKLRGCSWEPRITSLEDDRQFDLCSLCNHLHKKRLRPPLKPATAS